MKRRAKPSRPGQKRAKSARAAAEQPDAPAVITRLHRQDRIVSAVAGAPKAWRRIDRLQWLRDHGGIGDHQLHAGRRLQADWQTSRIEAAPRMMLGSGGGGAGGTLSDAALDAGQRMRKAMAVLPGELRALTELFLMPEDIPFSLERCAAIAAILAAGALAATPASAAVYDFTFLTNNNVLSIANGVFTTNATNNIISASGTLTSTNAALLGGVGSLSFTLAGPGAGSADSEIWDNVYSTVTNSFSGAGIGLLLGNGHIATIYDVAGYAPCPGATCISVPPTSNGAYWDPGAAGRLVISAVPEPASWAMMLLGFGGIGFMLRGSRRKTAVATA